MFSFPVRIYYEDTDAGGVVYYANYLRYAERARTEFIRSLGFEQKAGMDEAEKFGFMVKRVEIDYKAPAVLDDLLDVTAEVVEFGGASVVIRQQIKNGDKMLADLMVTVVYVSYLKKRPTRIPEELVAKMKAA